MPVITKFLYKSKKWLLLVLLLGIVTITIVAINTKLQIWSEMTRLWTLVEDKEKAKFILNFIGTLATIIGGIVVFLNLLNAQKNTRIAQTNASLAEARLITDRFSKAVEQLGHERLEIRLGGIYTFEWIARDAQDLRDREAVIKVLITYIRECTSFVKRPTSSLEGEARKVHLQQIVLQKNQKPETPPKPPTDVQAALDVIKRLLNMYEKEDIPPIDFKEVDIRGANLEYARLTRADFRNSKLEYVNFRNAHLEEADLTGSNLSDANLVGANLSNAEMMNVTLVKARFYRSNLNGTNFYNANLEEANLTEANLQGATLTKANLTGASLSGAKSPVVERAILCRTTMPDNTVENRDCL
ncbi:MAG: pentapeptide repeat-containing protein [Oculatellaceae cyanobacterium bins.114]|nr:pentapeptide repeat-containing protein [Oculatellaceae cyanobacterium bins.114]